jgi:hypothetical protein
MSDLKEDSSTSTNLIKLIYRKIMLYLTRKFIQIIGVRFYKSVKLTMINENAQVVIRGVKGEQITFRFFKEPVGYLLYRRGKIHLQKFSIFMINAEFSDSLPNRLKNFSNIRLFAKKKFLFHDDSITFEVLLKVYLDFIENIIKLECE